tara:strand:+ start:25 stop:264 length:240 start_codon:yes stop_codon:yes gene_type:complete
MWHDIRHLYRYDKKGNEDMKNKSSMRDMSNQEDKNDIEDIDSLEKLYLQDDSAGWFLLKATLAIFVAILGVLSLLIIPV